MAVWETNKNIIAALQTVIDLPDRITSLTVSIGVDKMPELTLTRVILSKDYNGKREVFTVTKRYTLSEINAVEKVDVSTLMSSTHEYVLAPPVKGSVA